MRRKQLRMGKGFRLALGHCRLPAAEMVLPLGDTEGDPKIRHHDADQWRYVVSGMGPAKVNGKSYPLRAATLLQIERDDKHWIRNTCRSNWRTINFYALPAYTKSGDPSPTTRPGSS